LTNIFEGENIWFKFELALNQNAAEVRSDRERFPNVHVVRNLLLTMDASY